MPALLCGIKFFVLLDLFGDFNTYVFIAILRLRLKYYLRGLLYNKEFAALQKSLSSCPNFIPWDVEIRPCASGSSNECQQRARRSTELQFSPSITSISRSLVANSCALAKNFSSVVFLGRLSRQFGVTGRKAAWHSEISSRYKCFKKDICVFHRSQNSRGFPVFVLSDVK